MWFCKKKELLECHGCGCLMRFWRKKVELRSHTVKQKDGSFTYHMAPVPPYEYYCGKCAPPYDLSFMGSPPTYYRKERKEIEVTEKGKDVKATS